MAWNIMLFNKTFHVEHIYFSIHVPRKFTTPYHTPNRYVERGEWYYMTKGRGWGYQREGMGVSKITIIIGIEHYTPTSPLH